MGYWLLRPCDFKREDKDLRRPESIFAKCKSFLLREKFLHTIYLCYKCPTLLVHIQCLKRKLMCHHSQ